MQNNLHPTQLKFPEYNTLFKVFWIQFWLSDYNISACYWSPIHYTYTRYCGFKRCPTGVNTFFLQIPFRLT